MTRPSSRWRRTVFARRLTRRIVAPAISAANRSGGWGWRIVRSQLTVASVIVAPATQRWRSRATVSTSGSSGMLRNELRGDLFLGLFAGHIASGLRHPAPGAGIVFQVPVHLLPVLPDLQVHLERHVERQGRAHDVAREGGKHRQLVLIGLEDELVVDLEQHL